MPELKRGHTIDVESDACGAMILDRVDASDLISAINSYRGWLDAATSLVVIGLGFEYAPAFVK